MVNNTSKGDVPGCPSQGASVPIPIEPLPKLRPEHTGSFTERFKFQKKSPQEKSHWLSSSGLEFPPLGAREATVLCHMLNGEYEKAAKKAKEYGFKELAEDAAFGLVTFHLRVGDFPSAARIAKRYGLGNHAANAAFFWAYAEAEKGSREDHARALGILKKYVKLATGVHRDNLNDVIAGMEEKLAPYRKKSAFESCLYVVASLFVIAAAWVPNSSVFINGCSSRVEDKMYERAFTRENPAEPSPANYAPLKERLIAEALAYANFILDSQKLSKGAYYKVTQIQIREFPNPRAFRVEGNGTCTSGSSAAWFLATLTDRKSGKRVMTHIKLEFTCTKDGTLRSSGTWSIDETKGASRLPQPNRQDSARTFCDKRFPHKKQARPDVPRQLHRKHMHPKVGRAC